MDQVMGTKPPRKDEAPRAGPGNVFASEWLHRLDSIQRQAGQQPATLPTELSPNSQGTPPQ